MIIYFFKDRSKGPIDFYELIDGYFDKIPNAKITSNDEEVFVDLFLPSFDCSYRFSITKRSRVKSLYRLNADYSNTFLVCEMPNVVPQFVFRLMLKQVEDVCAKFELAIYHDMMNNICEFNMLDLIQLFPKERAKYLEDHPEIVTYKVDQDMLNEICECQSKLEELPKLLGRDIVASPYIVLKDNTNRIYFSVNWHVGVPTTFPPHLDFVHIEEEENLVSLVPIHIFYKYVERYMTEIKDGLVKTQIKCLREKESAKAKKLIKKMRKSVISTFHYEVIQLTDLIEK